MSICQAENGFSLDELVKKLAASYKTKALGEILKMNLLLTQEVLMYRIFNGKSDLQCCSDGHWAINESFEPGDLKSVTLTVADTIESEAYQDIKLRCLSLVMIRWSSRVILKRSRAL